MIEWILRAFQGHSGREVIRDVADVLIVSFVIYRSLMVIRGTRAMQMGLGLVVIFLLYLASKLFNLIILQSLLGYLLPSIIVIVVVIFQNDIRRALIRVGGQAWFGRTRRQEQSRVIDEVVAATTELARHRIGAIIAFEQDANLLEFTKSEGTLIGAAVSRELLVAMFYPESVNKLHDGALIIRDLKIARAGVFFPMPDTKILDKQLGSRHRAAIGITEETDAVVVVVSEERGVISFCFNGNIVPNLDGTALRQTLVGLLEGKGKFNGQSPKSTRPNRGPDSGKPDRPLTTPLPVDSRSNDGRSSDGRSGDGRGPDSREQRVHERPRTTRSPELPPEARVPHEIRGSHFDDRSSELPPEVRLAAGVTTSKPMTRAMMPSSPDGGRSRSKDALSTPLPVPFSAIGSGVVSPGPTSSRADVHGDGSGKGEKDDHDAEAAPAPRNSFVPGPLRPPAPYPPDEDDEPPPSRSAESRMGEDS